MIRFDALDAFIVLFVVLSLTSGVLFTGNGFPENAPQVLWGAKYGLFFLLLFFCVRRFSFFEQEKSDMINVILFSGCAVIFFGTLQAVLLPENFLIQFGYNEEYGVTEVNNGISYCHKIENSLTHEEFCRSQSTLSGPNQLGVYLLILLPLFLYRILRARSLFTAFSFFLPFLFGTFLLLLTWSRSAWIGAAVMCAAFFVVQSKRTFLAFLYLLLFFLGIVSLFFPILFIEQWDELKFLSITGAQIVIVVMILFLVVNLYHRCFPQWGSFLFPIILGTLIYVRSFFDTFFWNILLRPSSSQGHWERWGDGVQYIKEYPLGLGLGDAGPASARFARFGETGFLPESWYLQVGLESGLFGLFLFLGTLFFLGRALLRSSHPDAKPIFLSLTGISVACFFLHSWESAVVSFTLWAIAGVVLAQEKDSSLFQRMLGRVCRMFRRER
jgi:hypothetical protein